MPDSKLLEYDPAWPDEKVIESDDNFKDSERDVDTAAFSTWPHFPVRRPRPGKLSSYSFALSSRVNFEYPNFSHISSETGRRVA